MNQSAATTQTERNVPRHTPASDLQPSKDIVEYLKEYARDKPDVAALWCFGLGFVIGWKLKPW